MSTFFTLLRVGFGLVFIVSSLGKIAFPADFALSITLYQIFFLPHMLVNAVAHILPWVEFLCGLALITNCFSTGAALILNTMLVLFTGVLFHAVLRDINPECGCFPGFFEGDAEFAIKRNLVLLVPGLTVLAHSFLQTKKQWAAYILKQEAKKPLSAAGQKKSDMTEERAEADIEDIPVSGDDAEKKNTADDNTESVVSLSHSPETDPEEAGDKAETEPEMESLEEKDENDPGPQEKDKHN